MRDDTRYDPALAIQRQAELHTVRFGSDGIRGLAGEWPLVPENAERIGRALSRFLDQRGGRPAVVIGRDTRPSGAWLVSKLTSGLTGQGVAVTDVGVVTTPGVAFLARLVRADLGVIVSASHNPPEYNGIKLVGPDGLRLQREDEVEIEGLLACETVAEPVAVQGRRANGRPLVEVYIQDLMAHCPAESLAGLKVVLDCANGSAARIAPEAFRRLGAEAIVLNDGSGGQEINCRCGSEYVRERPENLAAAVRRHRAAYGLAFDGDGDRLQVIDREGRGYDGNDLLFVLGMHFHSQGLLRRSTVVTTEVANRGLVEALGHAGIHTVYADKGDKNVEAALRHGGYLLGGEPGGNVIINDGHQTAADAIHTALLLAAILAQRPQSLSDLAAPLQKRPQVTASLRLPATLTDAQHSDLRRRIRRWQQELGADARIRAWDATSEPGVFRIMVEGGPGSTAPQVYRVAEALTELVRQMSAQAPAS